MGCNCSRSSVEQQRRETQRKDEPCNYDEARLVESEKDYNWNNNDKEQLANRKEARDANGIQHTNRILMMNAQSRIKSANVQWNKQQEVPFGFIFSKLIDGKRNQRRKSIKIDPVNNSLSTNFHSNFKSDKPVEQYINSQVPAGNSSQFKEEIIKKEDDNKISLVQHLQVPSFGRQKSTDKRKFKKTRLKVEPEEESSRRICSASSQTTDTTTTSTSDLGSSLLVSKSIISVSTVSDSSSILDLHDKMSTIETQLSSNTPTTSLGDQAGSKQSKEEEEVKLFTSVQQLCHETISCCLLNNHLKRNRKSIDNQTSNEDNRDKVLCLFLFGCQGSNKGELAYDLVQHSPLLKALNQADTDYSNSNQRCPLYHYLDVGAIIVANLDQRIREYHGLLARTVLYNRRQQMSRSLEEPIDRRNKLKPKPLESLAFSSSQDSENVSEETNDNQDKGQNLSVDQLESISLDDGVSLYSGHSKNAPDSRDLSISSDYSPSDRQNLQTSTMQLDDFGQITLSTKQRSILQLKLMKYYNSITSKWVYSLIKQEVDKLERTFEEKFPSKGAPSRVYLINLVPNQLNLFKSCLYLKQNSIPSNQLGNYQFWAIKFERRTNIKLSVKERASLKASDRDVNSNEDSDKHSGRIVKNLQLRIANIRLPILSGSYKSRSVDNLTKKSEVKQDIGTIASSLACEKSKESEKLGPKLNENLIHKFLSIGKLTVMRYNPIRDYNYFNKEEEEQEEEEEAGGENLYDCTSLTGSDSNKFISLSCAEILSRKQMVDHEIIKEESCDVGCRLTIENDNFKNVSEKAKSSDKLSADYSQPSSRASSIGVNSICESSISGVSLEPCLPTRKLSRSNPLTSGICPIKSAIEIELFSSSLNSNQTNEFTDDDDNNNSEETNAESSSSQPRIVFNRSSNVNKHKSSELQHHGSFKLTPVKIAYANQQTQTVYEAKRYHSRTLKIKRSSDFYKLIRLIEKATIQLATDCKSWLYDSIKAYNLSQARLSVCCEKHQRKRHSISNSIGVSTNQLISACNQFSSGKRVALIVYTIKLDISRIEGKHFQFPANFQWNESVQSTNLPLTAQVSTPETKKLLPSILVAQQTNNSASLMIENPLTAAPLRSNSASIQRNKRPAKRHVQFRLSKAPGKSWNSLDKASKLQAQQRKWIGDSLFVSATNENFKIDLLVELVKFYMRDRCQ